MTADSVQLAGALQWLVKKLAELIGIRIKEEKEQLRKMKEEIEDSLKSLGEAAVMTRALYDRERFLSGMNDDAESLFPPDSRQKVADAWLKASTDLASLQGRLLPALKGEDEKLQGLVNRCFNKGLFWANPREWEELEGDLALDGLVTEVRGALLELNKIKDPS